MTNTPLTRKAAANKGISVHLYCKARGSPLPRFSWVFNRKTLSPNTTENKYSITHSDVSHFIRCTYLLNNDFLYRYISFRVPFDRSSCIVLRPINLISRLTLSKFYFDKIFIPDVVREIFTVGNLRLSKE